MCVCSYMCVYICPRCVNKQEYIRSYLLHGSAIPQTCALASAGPFGAKIARDLYQAVKTCNPENCPFSYKRDKFHCSTPCLSLSRSPSNSYSGGLLEKQMPSLLLAPLALLANDLVNMPWKLYVVQIPLINLGHLTTPWEHLQCLILILLPGFF